MVGHKGVELVAAKHITPESEASRERGRYRVRAHRETEPFSSRSIAAKSVRSSPPLTCQRRQGKDLGHIRQKRSRRHTSPAASPAFLRIRDWNSSKSCAGRHCQPDYDKARGGETHELSVAVVIEEVEELLEIAAPHAPICTDVVSTAGSHAERRKGDGQAAWRSRWTALSIRSADCEPRSGEPSVCDTVTSSGGIENAITCRRTVSWEACAASHDSVRVRTLPSLVSSLRSAGEPATVSSSTANFSCGSVPAVTESTDGWRESR